MQLTLVLTVLLQFHNLRYLCVASFQPKFGINFETGNIYLIETCLRLQKCRKSRRNSPKVRPHYLQHQITSLANPRQVEARYNYLATMVLIGYRSGNGTVNYRTHSIIMPGRMFPQLYK